MAMADDISRNAPNQNVLQCNELQVLNMGMQASIDQKPAEEPRVPDDKAHDANDHGSTHRLTRGQRATSNTNRKVTI